MTTGNLYRGAWTAIVCVLGAAGVLLTFFALSSFAIVSAGFAGAVMACAVYPPLYRGSTKRATAPRHLAMVAAIGAGFALAVAGPLDLLGPSALVLSVVVAGALALTSPAARWRYAQCIEWLRSDAEGVAFAAEPGAAHEDADEPAMRRAEHAMRSGLGEDPQSVSDLSLDQLCRAWQTTFALLETTDDAWARSVLAEVRHGYLDELQRRDPVGFDRWLASDGGAATDPARFLTEAGHHTGGDGRQ